MNIDARPIARPLLAVSALALATSLAACGGTGGGRPGADELSTGIAQIFEDVGQKDLFTEKQLTCLSEGLEQSELSDSALRNIADGKDIQKDEEEKQQVTEVMATLTQECITAE